MARRRRSTARDSPSRRLELARLEQLQRAHDPLAVAGFDLGRRPRRSLREDRRAAPRARARSSSRASARARPPAGGGRRLSSVSAARRYSPVPPTTIGRRPARSSPSISAWASSAYRPALNVASTGRNDDQPVLELCPLGAARRPRSASAARRRPAARRPRPRPDRSPRSRRRCGRARSRPRSCPRRSGRTGRSPRPRIGAEYRAAMAREDVRERARRCRRVDRATIRSPPRIEAARSRRGGARGVEPPIWRWCSPAARTSRRPRRRSPAITSVIAPAALDRLRRRRRARRRPRTRVGDGRRRVDGHRSAATARRAVPRDRRRARRRGADGLPELDGAERG